MRQFLISVLFMGRLKCRIERDESGITAQTSPIDGGTKLSFHFLFLGTSPKTDPNENRRGRLSLGAFDTVVDYGFLDMRIH